MFCKHEELANESDVEQKFILPLLTSAIPSGLGYGTIDIRTKPDIRRLKLDKGQSEKLYHPDYAIVIAGIPVFVVEAKRPDEDPVQALREARLYAVELNASFPHGVNPCQRVIASNGLITVTSPIDQAAPDLTLTLANCTPSSPIFEEFVAMLSRSAAQSVADNIRNSLTTRPLSRAIQFVGGRSARDEDVGYNDFGSRLAIGRKVQSRNQNQCLVSGQSMCSISVRLRVKSYQNFQRSVVQLLTTSCILKMFMTR